MSRWYRAYAGTVKDDKLAEVAIVAGCSRSVAIAVWHAILESAAETDGAGRFETTARRVAATLGEPAAVIEAAFAAMLEIGMLEGNAVAAWKRRQYESDSSTERSRKHREAKRNVAPKVGDGDATLQRRCATPPEAEADTETETKEDTAGAASSPTRAPAVDLIEAERRCQHAAGADRLGRYAPIAELLERGADLERDILPVMRARPASGGAISSWKFYVPIIAEAMLRAQPATAAASTGPPKTHVMKDTPEWDAWVRFEGRAHPVDAKGGWLFPSRLPPKIEKAA